MREDEEKASTAVFQAYRIPLLTVMEFKYLEWVLTTYDYEWKEVVVNLQKALSIWASLFIILGQERSEPRTFGTFYKAVVQANLLLGLET